MSLTIKIFDKKAVFHVTFWSIFYLLFMVFMTRMEGFETALKFSLVYITPLIIPVYLHDFIFERFFKTGKYIIYTGLTLFIIIVFGYIHERLFAILFGGEMAAHIALAFFIATFTGIKYLRTGTRQQFQLHREESRRLKAELELQKVESRHTKAELELLKAQLNPHFLFNSLNNIYSLILSNDKRAGETVLKLSGLMRYTLDSAKQKLVTLKEESDFIEHYITLEKIRLNGRCDVKLRIAGEKTDQQIAPMLFTPLVENSFKHGIGVGTNNFIHIEMLITPDNVTFKISNRIVPNKNRMQEKAGKIGLENLNRRLEILYPGRHDLKIHEDDETFNVNMRIDF